MATTEEEAEKAAETDAKREAEEAQLAATCASTATEPVIGKCEQIAPERRHAD